MLAAESRTIAVDGARAHVRFASWDARALGILVLELLEIEGMNLDALLSSIDELCGARQIGLATTRIPARALDVLQACERAGYRRIERSRVLRLAPIDIPARLARDLAIEHATLADAPALAELAGQVAFSRYHEDVRIHPTRARARMQQWIVDSLGNGDDVIIARRDGRIVAMMSLRRVDDHARLWLGATDANAGPIGPMFWAAVLRALAARGVRSVETRVSVANEGALRLHQALGFVADELDVGLSKVYPVCADVVGTPLVGSDIDLTT